MAMSTMMLKFNTPTPTTTTSSYASYATPLLIPNWPVRPPPRRAGTSIRSSSEGRDDASNKFDRRNLLLGLGGMYGATAVGGAASGAPVQPPDLTACHRSSYPDGFGDNTPVPCCPPYDLSKPLDVRPYVLPPRPTRLRARKAVQKLNKKEMETFKNAVKAMKDLNKNNDPWSFMQQANIHCAYCNDGYDQKGHSGVPLQVHFSWLFLPWHRWYLYFFEKILGKLIGDDSLALPYWNYDCEAGMKLPDIYKDVASSLYNPNRNLRHNDQIMFLNWSYDLQDTPVLPTVVTDNLKIVANLYKRDNLEPTLFMGEPARAGQVVDQGETDSTSGKLELLHNVPHGWVGQVEPPNLDMGNFYSAARDAVFYAHHSQVDRLWEHYRSIRNYCLEFNQTDWLDAKFVFYDENKKIVTVTTRQCLDIGAMGYEFEDVGLTCVPKPTVITAKAPAGSPGPFGSSRRKLDGNIFVTVQRPKASRTEAEKDRAAEVLSVDGLEFTTPDAVSFDVYLSNSKQDKTVLAGSFSRVRHENVLADGSFKRMNFKEGITSEVEGIGADDDSTVVVTIVPHTGNVTIGGVHIELVPRQIC